KQVKKIVEECSHEFDKHPSVMDTEKYLVAFPNGVLDLKLLILREGRREDNLSRPFPYNFLPYDRNHVKICQLVSLLNQQLPGEGVTAYVLSNLAATLWRKPLRKVFILYGDGANAKSLFSTLIRETFGHLGIQVNVKQLCKKIDINKPNKELKKAFDAWVISINEGEPTHKWNPSSVKIWTRENTEARDLNESGDSGVVKAPLFVCLNHLPRVGELKHAFWRRIVVIPMPSRFVNTQAELDEATAQGKQHVFLAERDLEDDDNIWEFRPALMSILHKTAVAGAQKDPTRDVNFPIPPAIKSATDDFFDLCDYATKFSNQFLTFRSDAKCHLVNVQDALTNGMQKEPAYRGYRIDESYLIKVIENLGAKYGREFRLEGSTGYVGFKGCELNPLGKLYLSRAHRGHPGKSITPVKIVSLD
ncbi:hypothetical protein HDV00_000276, partial [Rhizophlyctis rosea]